MKVGAIGSAKMNREELMEAVIDDLHDARQALRNLHQEASNIDHKMAALYDGQMPLNQWRERLNTFRRELEDMTANEERNLRILKRR